MIKKLMLAFVVLFSLVGVAYAGCWQTQVTNKVVDGANIRRLVLQCIAQRQGGYWNISSGDTYMTKSGVTISTTAPVNHGSFWSMDVKKGSQLIASTTFQTGGYYADINYFADGGNEVAWCQVVYVMVGNPIPPTFEQNARYCR